MKYLITPLREMVRDPNTATLLPAEGIVVPVLTTHWVRAEQSGDVQVSPAIEETPKGKGKK